MQFIVNFKETTLIGAHGPQEEIDKRAEQIRGEIATSEHDFMAKLNRQRLANLAGAVGIIYVGGETEAEIAERRFRVDDALQATQAAVRGGIVAGGGITLRNIANKATTSNGLDMKLNEMFMQSMLAVFNQICTNAGKNPDALIGMIDKVGKENTGYNALTDKIEDLITTGVIDPTLVISSALTAASSVAQLLITTSVTVNPLKTQDSIDPLGGDMSLLNQ